MPFTIDDQQALATLQLSAFCEKNYHTAFATETSIKISLLKRFSIL